MMEDKLSSALVGAGGAALWWWAADQQDRDQRIRDNSLDVRDFNRRITGLVTSADWIRLTAPIVRDVIVGTAAASPTTAQPQTVPPLTGGVIRPDLTQGSNISSLQWPPTVGVYDATGRTGSPGELALATYVRTYQEPRAFDQGLVGKNFTSEGLQQLFYSAQGLSWNSQAQKLTQAQWQSVWANILANGGAATPAPTPGPSPTTTPNAHDDQAKVPTASTILAANIVPLNNTTLGSPAVPYKNPQTDSASRWRITTAGGGHNAGDRLVKVVFKTEFTTKTPANETVSFQPVVLTQRPQQVFADNITSQGFELLAGSALDPNTTYDVFVSVFSGVGPS